MLPYYAGKFPTVEINYTFYRMPTPKLIAGWRAQVPPEFRFTLKAPKRITHDKRLRAAEVAESVSGFITAASELGPQLAALLFQLPPNFKKDLGLLNEFLALLPPKTTAAFEFRNASWLEDDVFEALRARNLALCIADSETRETPIVHDRGLRLSAAARRRLWRRRNRASGPTTAKQLGERRKRRVRVFQARRRRQGRGVRPTDDATAGTEHMTISDLRSRISDQLTIAGCLIAATMMLAGCNQTRVAEAPTTGEAARSTSSS